MKGLLVKHKYMVSHNAFMYVIILVMWLIYAIYGIVSHDIGDAPVPGNLFALSWSFMYVGVIGTSSSNADNQSKWNMTVHTLPYKRSEIVSVEYICVLISQALALLLFLLLAQIMKIFGVQHDGGELLALLMLCVGFGMTPMLIFYPIMTLIKQASMRSILGGFMGFVSVMMIFAVNYFYENTNDRIAFSLIFFLAIAVLYALSWLISVNIMKNKDII